MCACVQYVCECECECVSVCVCVCGGHHVLICSHVLEEGVVSVPLSVAHLMRVRSHTQTQKLV